MEKFIDDQITKAMKEGAFDDLPGKGKPIDLTSYFQLPEELRVTYRLLQDNKFVPEEAELMREIEALKRDLGQAQTDSDRSQLKRNISERTVRLNLLLEIRKRKRC